MQDIKFNEAHPWKLAEVFFNAATECKKEIRIPPSEESFNVEAFVRARMKQIKKLQYYGVYLIDFCIEYNLFENFVEQLDHNFNWDKIKNYKTSVLADRKDERGHDYMILYVLTKRYEDRLHFISKKAAI